MKGFGVVFSRNVLNAIGHRIIIYGIGIVLVYTAIFVGKYYLPEARLEGMFDWNWAYESYGRLFLTIHILTAVPPLVIGPLMFNPQKRAKNARQHIYYGTVYCVCIWVSAVFGGILAANNHNGIGAQLGFGSLAVAWFVTTYFAYKTARAKNFFWHRRWMIRSYAITLAAVSIRPLFHFAPETLDPKLVYVACTWLCWVPNLILAEMYLRFTTITGRFKSSG